jgi:putative oxidoreductase
VNREVFMEQVLGKFSPQIYALLRIVAGLLFAQHGAQKLFGALGGEAVQLGSLMGLAGVIELGGGLLIAVGLFGSLAAFVASGEMAAAYFMAHAGKGIFPIQNGGERAMLYCFLFLYIASRGSGAWSIDAARGKGKK